MEPFERADHSLVAQGKFDACWLNDTYTVLVREFIVPNWPQPMTHLSIKRNDKDWIHDWRDLQQIKNEVLGIEREGIELYPAESRLVDEANQYHLYVLPAGHEWPVGVDERQIGTPEDAEKAGARQRPFAYGQIVSRQRIRAAQRVDKKGQRSGKAQSKAAAQPGRKGGTGNRSTRRASSNANRRQ